MGDLHLNVIPVLCLRAAAALPEKSAARDNQINAYERISRKKTYCPLTPATLRTFCRNLGCLIGLLAFTAALCNAQALDPRHHLSQYAHSAWRLKDGIFPGVPSSIAQTSDGYVWIATAAGLVRFDGVSFETLDEGEAAKFPSGSLAIRTMTSGRDGKLWVGTNAGIVGLTQGTLTDVIPQTAEIAELLQDRGGAIWATRERMGDYSEGPLCRIDGQHLTCFGAKAGFPITAAHGIIQDPNGDLLISVLGGLVRFNNALKQIYPVHGAAIGDGSWVVTDVALDSSNQPVISIDHPGTKGGIFVLADGSWKPFSLPGDDLHSLRATRLMRDRHGSLWIGTADRGLYRVSGTRVDRFSQEDGLSSNSISDIMEDREGNVWVVTSSGVDNFRSIPVVQFGKREGLHSDGIVAVTDDRNGGLSVSTDSALDHVVGDTVTSTTAKDSLPGSQSEALLVDHRGTLWVGVVGSLYIYEDGAFRMVERTKGKQAVNAIAEDGAGDIWVSFSGPTRSLARIHDHRLQQEFLPPAVPGLFSVISDVNGAIWLSITGQRWLKWVDGRWEEVKLDSLDLPSRKIGSAYNIAADREGTIWGMTKNGVVAYRDGLLRLLTTANGLPCNFTYSGIVDAHDALWVFSQCGLFHIQRSELNRWWQRPESHLVVEQFDMEDGVQTGVPVMRPPVAQTSDGRLWFSNGSTLQVVDPDHLTSNNSVPPVQLVRAVVDGRTVSTSSPLRVPPAARDVQIDYTALSFTMPQRVRFKYRLSGYDADWQQPGARRSAFYSNLRPGRYSFQVIAANEAGIWNLAGRSIEFIVEPAWYQTRWFMALCALLAAALLYGFYWLRVRQLRNRLQLQYETRLEERTRVARDLHDTLLQTIQGTRLVAEEALRGNDDSAHLHNVVAKIYEWLTRAVIEGRAALTTLRTSSSAAELSDKLRGAAEACSRSSQMELKFAIIGTPIDLSFETTEEIFRIGYEAIRNACAHSQGSILEVQLLYSKLLKLIVKDNGIGIGFELQGASGRASGHYGLEGMRERAQQLGGSLELSSTPGSGTEIILNTKSAR